MTEAAESGGEPDARSGWEGAVADTRPTAYVLPTSVVVALAAVTALAVWARHPLPPLLMVCGLAVFIRTCRTTRVATPSVTWIWCTIAVVLAVLGSARSSAAWDAVAPDALGPFSGWVEVIDDPQPYLSSTRVIVGVDGERFEMWARGRAFQQRVRRWRGGQWILVQGDRRALDRSRAGRVAWQHVVGELDVEWSSDERPGGPLGRASNRVRVLIEDAATHLPPGDGALFRGLVIGDDRDQSRAMLLRFRASGLSHLTAVSGQNVAFVLASAGPLLARLRPWPRLLITIGLIGWFVSLTRFEPSIVRAGAMACLSATAFFIGALRSPLRNLALAVTALVLIDPLIVWSIGFWLSVGATAGVASIGPWLAVRLTVLGSWSVPISITLGAQAGVAVPSMLAFGRLPLVSLPANLLAVPVAGAVMLYGLPAGMLAGAVPMLGPLLMLPARFGTRWVDTVAAVAARLEPHGTAVAIGWATIITGVVVAAIAHRRDKNRVNHDDSPTDR